MIHLLDPEVTAPGHDRARLFAEVVQDWLPGVVVHRDRLCAEGAEIREGDGVVYVHPPRGGSHPRWVSAWLGRVAARAVVSSVALDARSRRPPEAIGKLHVFDLADTMDKLGGMDSDLPVAAREFASQTLAAVQPTLSRDHLRLFVSYRREDGEDLARRLADRLEARGRHRTWRDLDDLSAGLDFRTQIDRALADSDVLILLDTPSVAESEFVADEVTSAHAKNVPVVWVRVGAPPEEDPTRQPLPVPPARTPTLTLASADPSHLTDAVVDDLLGWVCRLAHEHARQARTLLARLLARADDEDWQVRALDMRQLVFEVQSRPRTTTGFPRRPRTDIVQVFGRHPQDQDGRELVRWLERRGLGPHGQLGCRSYDAAVMLDPIPRPTRADQDSSLVVAHGALYEDSLAPADREVRQAASGIQPPRLLLLGGFPAGSVPQSQVIAAVRAFVSVWLARGGTVTFGGHPSITRLVVRLASERGDGEPSPAVTVYQSTWWPRQTTLEHLPDHVRLVPVERADDEAASLSAMRRSMVHDDVAAAVVAIGGLTQEDGRVRPGVDEEVQLALEAGLPVFLVGGPGGRAGQLAAAHAAQDWSGLQNALSPDGNRRLLEDDDYAELARLVWSAVVE